MDATVFGAVLLAAVLHAAWNAAAKVGLDRLLTVALISISAGAVGLLSLPFVPVPQGTTWYWLAASVALHSFYKLSLVGAYRAGDLGQVYPIARGAAPLVVTAYGAAFLGELPSTAAMASILVLVIGVWMMAVRGGRHAMRFDRPSAGFALLTSAFIAAYTIVDGTAARHAVSASGYAVYLFLLDGLVMVPILAALRGPSALRLLASTPRGGIFAGVMSFTAYWIVIWAMTRAPLGAVAALRETSIVFAVLISWLFLDEPPSRWRLMAGLVIVGGAAALRLA